MILTDREIKISLDRGLFDIDPRPSDEAFSSTSVDLTLDGTLSTFRTAEPGLRSQVDPGDPDYDFNRLIGSITEKLVIGEGGHPLEPRELVLGWTREQINLKSESRVAARVEGKSSLARLGLAVHITAPTIHAGFRGTIQLEIINHGPLPIVLREGMSVCQLIIEQTLGVPERGYQGRFAGQRSS